MPQLFLALGISFGLAMGAPLSGSSEASAMDAAPLAAIPDGDPREPRVGDGDILSITVFNEPQLSGDVTVPANCLIQWNIVGYLDVCGKRTAEIRRELETLYQASYLVSPFVVVTVKQHGSQKIEVMGAVRTPGLQILPGPTPLLEIVMAAGGPISDNVLDVEIVRGDGAQELYSMDAIKNGQQVMVRSGDRVVVIAAQTIQVTGAVRNPGPQAWRRNMTAMTAFGNANELTQFGTMAGAIILRPDPKTGKKIRIKVPLARIRRGKADDIPMLPGDTMVINESVF